MTAVNNTVLCNIRRNYFLLPMRTSYSYRVSCSAVVLLPLSVVGLTRLLLHFLLIGSILGAFIR